MTVLDRIPQKELGVNEASNVYGLLDCLQALATGIANGQ
jgi:hypothetical protein